MRFTNIYHQARKNLGLSMNDYCIADCIYHYSSNPKSPVPGWCFASKQHIAEELGLTKSWVIKSISSLEDAGIIEKDSTGKYLKTTEKWYLEVVSNEKPIGVQTTPKSVYTKHPIGVQTTPPSYIESYTENKVRESDSENQTQKTLFEIASEVKAINRTASKNKKKEKEGDPMILEAYPRFVEAWMKEYPNYIFRAVDGKKMKQIIESLVTFRKAKDMEVTVGTLMGGWSYLLAGVKRDNLWYYGKNLSVWESKINDIIHEVKHGKTEKKSKSVKEQLADHYARRGH